MKKILVPTDFSPNADKALDYAINIAKKSKATIILVHICDLLDVTLNVQEGADETYNKKDPFGLRKKLSVYSRSIKAAEGVKVQTKLYRGLVAEVIVDAAKDLFADLIVMGTLGNAGVTERIFGGKTAAVISKTTVPVLAIPLLSEWRRPSKILLALKNFSEGNAGIIKIASELADLFNAKLQVVKFLQTSVDPDKISAIKKASSLYARKLKNDSTRIAVQLSKPETGNFEKSLDQFLSKNKVDIIAMVTHKRSFIQTLLKPGKTKRMSYRANIPLLALPATHSEKISITGENKWIRKVIF
jgi:nucleotide-binding universal stress UspA family protein